MFPNLYVVVFPQDVTLFGSRVIVDVISYDEVILKWDGALINMISVLTERENLETDTLEEHHVKMKAEI